MIPTHPRLALTAEDLTVVPETWPAPDLTHDGVTSLFLAGPSYRGQPTRAFAWYGCPAGPGPHPGVVLVHGGGGTAFAEWVKLWVNRGFAAISMDTCGCLPRRINNNWERHPAGGPPGWGGFDQLAQPPEDHWVRQAQSVIARAHTWLRAQPGVAAQRIGLTGISWGGYLTCLAASLDSRYQAAVPVYGCGYLGHNSAWLPNFQRLGAAAETWLTAYDPSQYLAAARLPFCWVNGTNDFAYPPDSWRQSARQTAGPRTLCLRIRMPHGHGAAGEQPGEILAFMDQHLRGGPGLAVLRQYGRDGERTWARFDTPVTITRAELCYTRMRGVWQERHWESQPATWQASDGLASAMVPPTAQAWYLNLVDERDLVTSSPHQERGD